MKKIVSFFVCILCFQVGVYGDFMDRYNVISSDGKPYFINHAYLEAANFLVSQDAIVNRGYGWHEYRLDDAITRAELIGIVLKMAKIYLPNTYTCEGYFADVYANSSDDWVCRAVEIAAKNGIISRENGHFRPNDTITKAEAIGILMKAKKIPYDRNVVKNDYKSGTPQWQIDILEGAVQKGIIEEYDTFGVNESAVRGNIFQQAVNTMIASGDVINMQYHYLATKGGDIYHYGHLLPNIMAEGLVLMEGDFFKNKFTVFKNFGCNVYACPEAPVIKIPLSPQKVKTLSYHYISDGEVIWNCASGRCKQIDVDVATFECASSFGGCHDKYNFFNSDGEIINNQGNRLF